MKLGQCDNVALNRLTTNGNGSFQSETRYSAYGEVRFTNGAAVTDKLYTGQQREVEIGLSYYVARFYDPVIAHFIQPDSIIPQAGASASYDRYAYVNGNPINFNDPSGKYACADFDENGKCIPESKGKVVVPTSPSPVTYIGNVPVIGTRESSLTIILNNGVKPPDLTYWLIATMQKNAKSATALTIASNLKTANLDKQVSAYQAWANMVGYGAPWDFKVELEKYNVRTNKLGNNVVDYQDLANIHYGYVGKAAGIPGYLLHGGAGAAAIYNEWISNKTYTNLTEYWGYFGDEPKDYEAINIGIYLYNAQTENSGVLTVELLNDAYQLIRGQ